jgi:hypothetical protein
MTSQVGGATLNFAGTTSEAWGEPDILDIAPNGTQDFYASELEPMPMPQAGYKHLEVSVSFTYTVLPIIHWHRKMVLGYKMVIATDGTRHWIEDDAAIKNIPNLRRGEKPTHPKD